MMQFSLIVPLWNEEKNISKLIDLIEKANMTSLGMRELILINNGSSDNTGYIIDQYAKVFRWIKPFHLTENLNYGGGVYEGLRVAKSKLVCYIPGDLQVLPDDVIRVYEHYLSNVSKKNGLFVKGFRVVRQDPIQTQIVSRIYTFLANIVLNLHIKDVNGLPKMFESNLLDLLPAEKMKTFVFDSQLLYAARKNNWEISEIPVTFYSRREGVSSWSKKRISTYFRIFHQLLKVRKIGS